MYNNMIWRACRSTPSPLYSILLDLELHYLYFKNICIQRPCTETETEDITSFPDKPGFPCQSPVYKLLINEININQLVI